MATAKITANLNGGDTVTPKDLLVFKIYGSSDGYVTPIKTTSSSSVDPNVSILGDIVTIENVDIGVQTNFRITSTDQGLNESEKSEVYTLEITDLNTELGSDLLAWFRDSSNNLNIVQGSGTVSEWINSVTSSSSANQLTVLNQPTKGVEGILFGASKGLKYNFPVSLTTHEVFFVYKPLSNVDNARILDFTGTNSYMIQQRTSSGGVGRLYNKTSLAEATFVQTLNALQIHHFIINGANSSVDGGTVFNYGANPTISEMIIGNRTEMNGGSNVELKEIVITKILTEPKRTSVLNYLNTFL